MLRPHWIERFEARGTVPGGDMPELERPAGTWQCDLSNDALTWSTPVFELFGIPRGIRVDRRDIVEMYTRESRALLDRLRSEAIAHCSAFTFEAQIRRPDGALRWMRVSADVVCRSGRATYLYGTKQDITDEIDG
ncbi:PAS domain-containing protein [Sphingomonas sp. Root241]|uniref:PAS domain-containing protein n=1 Tax=Sphingomonas sp. Root241 TaxID=1736501 RepID=UPI001F48203D|nr:PAS domain-containing protein [Sphingomonas sp. Root241]